VWYELIVVDGLKIPMSMTANRRGQVTIPKVIRDGLGFVPRSRIKE